MNLNYLSYKKTGLPKFSDHGKNKSSYELLKVEMRVEVDQTGPVNRLSSVKKS